MMTSSSDRAPLFNTDTKYVGISCGCHATEGEMCCFQYATDVTEKSGVKQMEVAMVGRYQCEESATWSDDKFGTPYTDPDDEQPSSEPSSTPAEEEPEFEPGPVDYS